MPVAASLNEEAQRLASLRDLGILDTPPEAEFDALVRVAALACDVPVALFSLVDAQRQWFKASVGLPGVPETPRDVAFCAHTIHETDLLEIADATRDPRFADNPLVTEAPEIRFYAGVPIRRDGRALGALSVIDRRPRRLHGRQRNMLRELAGCAAAALEAWHARRRQQDIALALQASEARLERLYSATPALQIAVSADNRVIMVSNAWLDRFGYAREEVIGREADDFLAPRTRAYRRDVVRPAFLRTGTCRDIEFQFLHKDGTEVEVLMSSFLERDAGGQPLYSVSVLDDITARRAAERSLAAEHRRLENIIEGTGAGTWEWNVRTGLLRMNERVARMLGRAPAELEPLSLASWREHLHPEDVARSNALLAPHLAGVPGQYQLEFRARHRDGHWVWILGRGAVMQRGTDGAPEWMYGTFIDITERKLAEEALRRSEKFLERSGAVAGVGGWEFELATGRITFSDATCAIYGVAPPYSPSLDEAIAFYPPESRPAVHEAVARAAAGGEGWDLELPFIRTDGRHIWVRTVGSVEFADGRPYRLFGAFQDVTRLVEKRLALEDAHERFAVATDSGRIGIWWWDVATGAIHWDDWVYRLYGIFAHDQDMTYEAWRRLVHPDDLAAAEQAGRDCIAGDRPLDTEFRVLWPDGSVHHLRATGRVTRDAAGRAVRVVGANWDITEPRQLASRLAEQHEMVLVTLRSIGDGVITTDALGRITWLNPVAERLTGWPVADAAGRALSEVFHVVHEQTREPAPDPVARCLAEDQVVGLASHTLLISRAADEICVEDSAAPIRGEAGETLGVVLVFHDVTAQRQLAGEMNWRASHDMLTGLINRAEFDARLRTLLHRAHGDHSENALLYVDLDQFKLVNDTSGHAAGDLLLQQVARLLSELVRASDTLARLGGDEFAVILDHCPVAQAQRLAQRICDRMEDFRFEHDGRRFRVGASIGLVPVDRRWPTIAALLQAADTACYAAKDAGRNRVHVWFDSDEAMRVRRGQTHLASRLAQALDEDRFVLFAQRIRRLRGPQDGLHAEVLLRMLDGDGALVGPAAFLPAAERFHMASRIDRWVLRRVVAWMQAAPLERIETLCVNLSGQSVGDRAFHRWAIGTLEETGDAVRRRLCLEITETAAVTNLADAAAFIAQVRAVGVRVALDDFGAGASSFGYLKSMQVDMLKIDGQFVRNLMDDPLDEVAVRCFADVASVTGMHTVAEFVDNAAVLDKLQRMGIDFAQGYLIHRPSPIEEMLALAA
jgi:diguanylate cyclase (GGDEF)-like protein/PAS domain S-box-containing protein